MEGRTFHLCMNGAALFDCYEKFGAEGFVTDPIKGNDKAAFENTCWMLAKFSEQGELCRRYLQHDRGFMGSEDWFRKMLKPLDVVAAKRAIEEAVRLGFSREHDEEDEIDLGLVELQKKTANALPERNICRSPRSFWRCLSGRRCS